MGARHAHRDPAIFRPGHGGAKGKLLVDGSPRFAAVGGDRRSDAEVVGFAIVAANDHTVKLVAECNRKSTGGFDACYNRRSADFPVPTSILGLKNSRSFGSAWH